MCVSTERLRRSVFDWKGCWKQGNRVRKRNIKRQCDVRQLQSCPVPCWCSSLTIREQETNSAGPTEVRDCGRSLFKTGEITRNQSTKESPPKKNSSEVVSSSGNILAIRKKRLKYSLKVLWLNFNHFLLLIFCTASKHTVDLGYIY